MPIAVFINVLTIVTSIFVIWDFIESREDKKLPDNGELLDEWDSHLGGINSQLEDAKLTLKQLTCRLETIQSSNKAVSPECRQFINQYKTTSTSSANSDANSYPVENSINMAQNIPPPNSIYS